MSPFSPHGPAIRGALPKQGGAGPAAPERPLRRQWWGSDTLPQPLTSQTATALPNPQCPCAPRAAPAAMGCPWGCRGAGAPAGLEKPAPTDAPQRANSLCFAIANPSTGRASPAGREPNPILIAEHRSQEPLGITARVASVGTVPSQHSAAPPPRSPPGLACPRSLRVLGR